MIENASDLSDGAVLDTGLVVIGAGPGGIVTALEAARRGERVTLVESGGTRPQPETQKLSVAEIVDPTLHAPVELAVSRQIGGTSAIWGGRCVPYDPVDFAAREITADSTWPVSYDELAPYFDRSCTWFKCGRAVFDSAELTHLPASMVPGLEDGEVTTTSLERWSLPTNFGTVYEQDLREEANLRLLTGATCVRVEMDAASRRATGITCRSLEGTTFTINADRVVIAAGGLESTRILLSSPGPDGHSLGNHSDQLGRWYMAHLEGVVADLVLDTPPGDTIYDYELDTDGSYVRRRFAFTQQHQLEHRLPNIVGWIANPELSDASHHSARLSMVYLALISPLGFLFAPPAQRMALTGTKIPGTPYGTAERSPVWAHVLNLFRQPLDLLRFAFGFGVKRVFSKGRKPPGFFARSRKNRYPFQYHGEHLPHADSRVTLSEQVDPLSMPMLAIDIKFTDEDIDGVVRAHQQWDRWLRASGVGRLEYLSEDVAGAVRRRIGGGFHQVGTTRMSRDPSIGVVDEHLAVHGVPNVHVVSSSTFVTSGQANSTFMIVVFALRLIDRLYGAPRN